MTEPVFELAALTFKPLHVTSAVMEFCSSRRA